MSCYYGAGAIFKAPDNLVPCQSSGESACCLLGDVCVGGNACFSWETGITYQYGCTDVSYQDVSCPFKCGWDPTLSPWVGLEYCSDLSGVTDAWVCLAPESCECKWTPAWSLSIHPPRACEAMGHLARAALFGPSILSPFASLPTTLGGSTGYYSTTVLSGVPTITVVPGYTPPATTQSIQYVPVREVFFLAGKSGDPRSPLSGATATPSSEVNPTVSPTAISIAGISGSSTELSFALGSGLGVGLGGIFCMLMASAGPFCLMRRRRRRLARTANVTALVPHWRVPAMMLTALLAGVFLATGHHLFYFSLAGKAVPQDDLRFLGLSLSRQQVNIAAGTAMAFLFNAFLTLAVSTAYFQALWTIAKSRNLNAPMTMSSLDAAFSVLHDLLAFLSLPLWLRNPLLLLLACVAWLVPIASIITPATLSVKLTRIIPAPVQFTLVPTLDFRSLSFSAPMLGLLQGYGTLSSTLYETIYEYSGPSNAVVDVANAVALQGNILPIKSPSSNASWNLQFEGPSIQCSDVHGPLRSQILHNIIDRILQARNGTANCYTAPFYLAWFEPNSKLPITNGTLGTSAGSVSYTDLSNSNATTYIAVLPWTIQSNTGAPWSPPSCNAALSGSYNDTMRMIRGNETTIVQCDLNSSRYNTTFHYINGTQHIHNEARPTDSISPAQIIGNVFTTGLGPFIPTVHNCVTIGAAANSTDYQTPNCVVNNTVLRQISYQSIFYAFNNLILGSIRNGATLQRTIQTRSNVLSTPLLRSKEFAFLAREAVDIAPDPDAQSLQNLVARNSAPNLLGITRYGQTTTNASLLNTLEHLFHNITISLMSSNELCADQSSITAPGLTNVTYDTYDNIYFYSGVKLWLSYGLATAATALAVAFGLFGVYSNQASYTNNFSSVFRLATAAEVSVKIANRDSYGNDPLPSYISEATVKFPQPDDDKRK